jgi:hypothetical protein
VSRYDFECDRATLRSRIRCESYCYMTDIEPRPIESRIRTCANEGQV